MSSIVQKVTAFATGAATVTATFPSHITAGNKIVVAVQAVDYSASIGASLGGNGSGFATVTDSQSNSSTPTIVEIYPTASDNETILLGVFTITPSSGAESVTFTFAPISAAGNCQVNGLSTASTANYSLPATGITEPLSGASIIPGVYLAGNGGFIVGVGALFTTDTALLTGNTSSGYTLDGAATATLNAKTATIGAQSQLVETSSSLQTNFGGPTGDNIGVGALLWQAFYLTTAIGVGGGGGGSFNGTDLSANSAGDQLTAPQMATLFPTSRDLGHVFDGIVYAGVISGLEANGNGEGIITPTLDLRNHTDETTLVRVSEANRTYSARNGDTVLFLLTRTSGIGDKEALLVTKS